MTSIARVFSVLLLFACLWVAQPARTQTQEWIRQDEIRRYNQQVEQERQRQEAQRNQERRDAEARERNQQYEQDAQRRQPGAASQGARVPDEMDRARQTWLKRPPLPADRNPLLGKWTRPASKRTNPSDPFAQLGAILQGGNPVCELMFGGGGVFEFRPDRLVGSDARTREQELDRVEYRGDARRVAVIPKTTYKLIVFDFDGPNRINWAGQDCVLVRAAGR